MNVAGGAYSLIRVGYEDDIDSLVRHCRATGREQIDAFLAVRRRIASVFRPRDGRHLVIFIFHYPAIYLDSNQSMGQIS
jgi:hypothetical protein